MAGSEKKIKRIKLMLTMEIDEAKEGLTTIAKATYANGKPLRYAEGEKKRMGKEEWSGNGAILATKNWCCWRYVAGKWICLPQYCV